MNIITKLAAVGIVSVAVSAMALDYVEVIDVVARQRYPWNGLVDIDFELDSKATEPYMMKVTVFDNLGKTNLPVKTVYTEKVSQKANPCMVTKDTTRIVWDAAADLPDGFKCTNVLVTCQDTRCVPTDKLYCVIDLSAGSKATSYPVTYLDSVPAGGWADEYKKTKMVFRRVDVGSLMMGSPSDETGRSSNETLHKVILTKPFYISIFEVTEKQYSLVMGGSGTTMKPKIMDYSTLRGVDRDNPHSDGSYGTTYDKSAYCWPDTSKVDSSKFIGKMRSRTHFQTLDLPTEAKWEFACRAGTVTMFNSGLQNLPEIGRYNSNKTDGRGDASYTTYTKVGCYAPNAWGLYDMHGNAPEWCLDIYAGNLGTATVTDPNGPAASLGTWVYSYLYRVIKGGSYSQIASECRSASRTSAVTEAGSVYTGSVYISGSAGIRLVFDAE